MLQAQCSGQKKAGGSSSDTGNGITTDASGNSFVTGYFNGTATFGGTSLISSGSNDMFIAKYDAAGNVVWARKAGGTGIDVGKGIAIDASGNSFITGDFGGSATFGGTTLVSGGNSDVFIVKYNTAGTVLWARKAGGTGFDGGSGISVDAAGNSYITGDFSNTATFASISLTSSGSSDIFVAKYNTAGTVLWAKKAGGNTLDEGFSIVADASGNTYVTGDFVATATFGSLSLTSSGGNDVFIAKYNTAGNVLWAVKAGGTSFDFGLGITVDASNNLYVTGLFNGTATFGPTSLTSSGDYEIFIAKLNDPAPPARTMAPSPEPNEEPAVFHIRLVNAETAALTWSVASETNYDHFDIERSEDGITFQQAGEVNANALSENNYEFTDRFGATVSPVLYYRLKQVEENGDFEYSEIKRIVVPRGENKAEINAWYNEAAEKLEVVITQAENYPSDIMLFDMQGKVVAQQSHNFPPGTNHLKLDLKGLSNGIYILKYASGKNMTTKKIIKT